MRYGIAFFALLFCLGCGNGGSPVAPPGGGLTAAQVAQALDGCADADLEDLLDLLLAYAPLLGNPGATPPFFVGPLAANEVPYSLDLDGDMTDDVVGAFRFTDATGAPVFPFQPQDIAAGFPGIIAVLPTLPDGTRFTINFSRIRAANLTGTIELVISGGVITSAQGSSHSQAVDCTVDFAFQGVAAADLKAAFPNLVMDADVTTTLGLATGTATFDGTNTALISLSVAGKGPFGLFLNLVTGVLTPAP